MTEQELEKFQVVSCNSSVWLIDSDREIATHCSDITWNREEYSMIYPATAANYQEFLADSRGADSSGWSGGYGGPSMREHQGIVF